MIKSNRKATFAFIYAVILVVVVTNILLYLTSFVDTSASVDISSQPADEDLYMSSEDEGYVDYSYVSDDILVKNGKEMSQATGSYNVLRTRYQQNYITFEEFSEEIRLLLLDSPKLITASEIGYIYQPPQPANYQYPYYIQDDLDRTQSTLFTLDLLSGSVRMTTLPYILRSEVNLKNNLLAVECADGTQYQFDLTEVTTNE